MKKYALLLIWAACIIAAFAYRIGVDSGSWFWPFAVIWLPLSIVVAAVVIILLIESCRLGRFPQDQHPSD